MKRTLLFVAAMAVFVGGSVVTLRYGLVGKVMVDAVHADEDEILFVPAVGSHVTFNGKEFTIRDIRDRDGNYLETVPVRPVANEPESMLEGHVVRAVYGGTYSVGPAQGLPAGGKVKVIGMTMTKAGIETVTVDYTPSPGGPTYTITLVGTFPAPY